MAIYHCSMKNGGVGKGKSHAQYIGAEEKYAQKSDCVFAENGNLPDFANGDAVRFFKSADEHERKNGRTYKEFELSLPRELNFDQNLELVKSFMDEAKLQNQPYLLAVHEGKNGQNPHAHLMFSERPNADFSEDVFFKRNGSKKDRTFNDKSYLSECRKAWEVQINQALEKAGVDEKVSCETLKKQGIDRLPQPKIGFAAGAIAERGENSKRRQRFDEVMAHNDTIRMKPVTELKSSVRKQKMLVPRLIKVRKIKADLAGLKKPRATAKVLPNVKAYMQHEGIKMHPLSVYNDTLYRFESAQRVLAQTPWYKPWALVQNAIELRTVSRQYDQAHSKWEPLHDKLDYDRQSANNELRMAHKNRVAKYDYSRARLQTELKKELADLESQFNVSFGELEDAVRPAVRVLEEEQVSMQLEQEKRRESDFKAFERQHQQDNKPSDFEMC